MPVDYRPGLNITKTATVDGGSASAGETINYTITVANTGNVTLTGVTVSDPYADAGSIAYVSGDTDGDGKLDVGETWTYTASHLVTQAEVDSNGGGDGNLENTATADSDQTDEDSDDAAVPVDYRPGLNITKTVQSIEEQPDSDGKLPPNDVPGEVNTPGATITYAIAVENTGNVSLTGVTVTDPYAHTLVQDTVAGGWNAGDSDQDGELDVGETWTWTATHVVTGAEYLNEGGDGYLENTATADSDQTGPDEASAEVPIDAAPHVDIIKQVDANGDGDFNKKEVVAGSDPVLVDYQYRVYQPTGGSSWHQSATTDPLSNINIVDDRGTADTNDDIAIMVNGVLQNGIPQANGDTYVMSISGDNGDGILQYGENWFIKVFDVEVSPDSNGQHTNKVYFTGEDDEGNPKEDSSDATVLFADIDVEKYVIINGVAYDADSGPGPTAKAGDTIQFKFVVKNTGGVDLTGVTVTDSVYDLNGGDPGTAWEVGNLAKGATAELVIAGTFQTGQHYNNATAEGTGTVKDSNSTVVVDDADGAYYFGEAKPGTGQSPGFWKNHLCLFNREIKEDPLLATVGKGSKWEDVFGNRDGSLQVGAPDIKLDSDGSKFIPLNPTLAQALAAKGGGEGALLRASTAALANAASDDLNFSFADSSKFTAGQLAILNQIDVDDDLILEVGEVINAVQDIYRGNGDGINQGSETPTLLATDLFNKSSMNAVAGALDAMNNLQHIGVGDFT